MIPPNKTIFTNRGQTQLKDCSGIVLKTDGIDKKQCRYFYENLKVNFKRIERLVYEQWRGLIRTIANKYLPVENPQEFSQVST